MNAVYNAHVPLVIAFFLFAAVLVGMHWRRR
jgi:hypothetical protein